MYFCPFLEKGPAERYMRCMLGAWGPSSPTLILEESQLLFEGKVLVCGTFYVYILLSQNKDCKVTCSDTFNKAGSNQEPSHTASLGHIPAPAASAFQTLILTA